MGWFNKDDDERIPELPELPKLPELPSTYSSRQRETLQQLPSLPSSELGDRFSQNMIKEAVTGEREEEDEVDEEEEFPQMKQMPLKSPMTREIIPERKITPMRREIPEDFREASKKIKEEPIFIRIDKFEDSLKIFEKTKDRIMEIEKMLKDIRRIKEEEEKELEIWEEEILNLKNQIEKVDQDIFSKIE